MLKYGDITFLMKIMAKTTVIERNFTKRDRFTQMVEQIRNTNTTVERIYKVPIVTTYKHTYIYHQNVKH